jgi:hypothetical protein
MQITYILGSYILLYRAQGLYFSGSSRAQVIEKALYYAIKIK